MTTRQRAHSVLDDPIDVKVFGSGFGITAAGDRVPMAATRTPAVCMPALPYYLRHYLELVDATGRIIRGDKRGSISKDIEPILDKLGFDEATWWAGIGLYGRPMFLAVGPADKLRQAALDNQRCWYRGTSVCQLVFGPP